MARRVEVKNEESKFSRESATRKQSNTTIEQHYEEWSKEENSDKSSTTLYDENGKRNK